MFGIVIELSVVAVLPGAWAVHKLTGLEQFIELAITVLSSKDGPLHLFSHVGPLTLAVVVAN